MPVRELEVSSKSLIAKQFSLKYASLHSLPAEPLEATSSRDQSSIRCCRCKQETACSQIFIKPVSVMAALSPAFLYCPGSNTDKPKNVVISPFDDCCETCVNEVIEFLQNHMIRASAFDLMTWTEDEIERPNWSLLDISIHNDLQLTTNTMVKDTVVRILEYIVKDLVTHGNISIDQILDQGMSGMKAQDTFLKKEASRSYPQIHL